MYETPHIRIHFMCETFSSKIKRFQDIGKIALKGQFYVIMIGVEVEIKNSSEQPQYSFRRELVAI